MSFGALCTFALPHTVRMTTIVCQIPGRHPGSLAVALADPEPLASAQAIGTCAYSTQTMISTYSPPEHDAEPLPETAPFE